MRDLNKGFVYFLPVHPSAIYQTLNYLRLRNTFYEDLSISEGLSNNEMLRFPNKLILKEIVKLPLKKSVKTNQNLP